MEVNDEDDDVAVIGTLPNSSKVYRFVGEHTWDDCGTIEEAISSAIHGMAVSAHKTY